jgi:hypothetical protein
MVARASTVRANTMQRECSECKRRFTTDDFVKEESKNMEAERKALGLEGVRFLYYTCSDCGHDAIFLDLHHLEDESPEEFNLRRAELEFAVADVHSDDVAVVISER